MRTAPVVDTGESVAEGLIVGTDHPGAADRTEVRPHTGDEVAGAGMLADNRRSTCGWPYVAAGAGGR
jgi:hypothetical protein